MFKKTQKIIAIAIVLTLCAGFMATTALADVPFVENAALTKMLRMPTGTAIPTVNFEFVLTPETAADAPIAGPAIGPFNIAFGAADAANVNTELAGMDRYQKQLDITATLNAAAWTSAGNYYYIITETANTNTFNPVAPVTSETITYSAAQYRLQLVVDYVNGVLGVVGIGAYRIVGDPGNPGIGKVDPTPGNEQKIFDGDEEFGIVFTNDFIRKVGEPDTPTPDNSALNVSKVVTGTGADQTRDFDFTLNLTRGPLDTDTGPITARIFNAAGTAIETISVTPGTAASFKLKHGEILALGAAAVGTTYVVTETGVPLYIPSFIITTAGVAAGVVPGSVGTDLPTGTQHIGDRTIGLNSAAFTNEREPIAPAGLSVNDIPFALLIMLAAGGLVTFVVIKVKKNKKYNEN